MCTTLLGAAFDNIRQATNAKNLLCNENPKIHIHNQPMPNLSDPRRRCGQSKVHRLPQVRFATALGACVLASGQRSENHRDEIPITLCTSPGNGFSDSFVDTLRYRY